MSDVVLYACAVCSVILGVRFLNEKGGVLGIAFIIAGLGVLGRAIGCEWINR